MFRRFYEASVTTNPYDVGKKRQTITTQIVLTIVLMYDLLCLGTSGHFAPDVGQETLHSRSLLRQHGWYEQLRHVGNAILQIADIGCRHAHFFVGSTSMPVIRIKTAQSFSHVRAYICEVACTACKRYRVCGKRDNIVCVTIRVSTLACI